LPLVGLAACVCADDLVRLGVHLHRLQAMRSVRLHHDADGAMLDVHAGIERLAAGLSVRRRDGLGSVIVMFCSAAA